MVSSSKKFFDNDGKGELIYISEISHAEEYMIIRFIKSDHLRSFFCEMIQKYGETKREYFMSEDSFKTGD